MTTRRDRPPQGVLSRERILLAGQALLVDEGLDAVSMRKPARRFEVDPMSLYNHVNGKDALLDGIAEVLLAALPAPPVEGDLRETMSAPAHGFRAAMLDHPRAAPLVLTRRLASMTAPAPVVAAGFRPTARCTGCGRCRRSSSAR